MKGSEGFTSRRELLHFAAAAAGTLWLPRSAWSQARFSSDPFALGIASGSPTHDSVVLWTRLVQDAGMRAGLPQEAVTVRWEIAHDAAFTRIAQSGQAQALRALGHSVHVEVPNLEPDRWYFYRFLSGDAVSPVGRTRTFPAPDAPAARLRLAYASCQRWEHGYFSAYRHMLAEDLDLVMFLGDYIYEYPGAAKAVRSSGSWTVTLDDYRRRYALHRSESDLRAMHAACPWLVTWDDHELMNDYAGATEGFSGPPEGSDFGARKAAAYQAFYEHMPLRASVLTQAMAGMAGGSETRIYGAVPFGRLATLYLLDTRQYRDRQACTPGGRLGSATLDIAHCPEWNDPSRTFLGRAQEQWLDGALAQGSRQWNVIGQQTLLGERAARRTEKILWNDGWDGYPAARTRFTDSLQRHAVANPVVLGGDIHENWVGHVKADYADRSSRAVGVEFCGTSISSRSGGNANMAQRLERNPHFVFADGERKGYGVVEFSPAKMTTSLRVVDDVTRRDTTVSTLAKFTVEAGRAKILSG